MASGEERTVRQHNRQIVIVGTAACLLAIAGGEANAQRSRILEFGPDAIDLKPRGRALTDRSRAAPLEPDAGTWRPWVLSSGSELRLPPPPDEAATARERRELRKLAVGDDAVALERVRYWDERAPAHRWNEMLTTLALRDDLAAAVGIRAFAMLNVAIDDALIAAWDSKYAYERPRPIDLDGSLVPEVAVPSSPSYPCEHAVTAGAAAAILAHLFPADADRLDAAAHEAAWSRVVAEAVYPSDVRAGLALGRAVAARVIAHAQLDPLMAVGLETRETPTAIDGNRAAVGSDARGPVYSQLSAEIGRRVSEAKLDANAPRAARAYALAYVALRATVSPSG